MWWSRCAVPHETEADVLYLTSPGTPAGQADERSNLLQRLGLAEASRSSSIEIEMTNFEHPAASAGQPGVEYAGSREGAPCASVERIPTFNLSWTHAVSVSDYLQKNRCSAACCSAPPWPEGACNFSQKPWWKQERLESALMAPAPAALSMCLRYVVT